MNYLYNNPKAKLHRRSLRATPTDAECTMWNILRSKRLLGLRFLRQSGVGKYILDFYCPALRLAIEIDGSQHVDSSYDIRRTEFLNEKDICVVRFWNNEVLENITGVYKKIEDVIHQLRSNPSHPPLTLRGGEEE